jgi:hypothetical protein
MAINPASGAIATALQDRWIKLRSHKRIISKVKLLVEWDEGSAPQCANAVTVDVSHSGCMADVVWRDHEAWDVGLELVKPDASFWGLKF